VTPRDRERACEEEIRERERRREREFFCTVNCVCHMSASSPLCCIVFARSSKSFEYVFTVHDGGGTLCGSNSWYGFFFPRPVGVLRFSNYVHTAGRYFPNVHILPLRVFHISTDFRSCVVLSIV